MEATMDSQKKKRNFLIGFGGAAVVLVAVLASWPPSFMNEDATGAIGAVQKHRTPQITSKDVVLVDESTRREEAVIYGDYFKDAAKLESISTDLALAMRNSADSVESRSAAASSSLESAKRDLQGHSADLQSRYLSSMENSLSAASQLLARNASSLSAKQIESAKLDIETLSARLQNRQQLASEEMASLNSRFADLADSLEAKSSGSRSVQALESDLASALSLGAASQQTLDQAAQQDAAAKLENLSQQLGDAATLDARLQHRAAYLDAMALEQKSLMNAEAALEAFSRNGLASKADAATLESASLDLASLGSRLESRAVDNMQARLKAQDELSARFKNMDNILESAKKDLGSRKTVLDSRFASALASTELALESRNTELQARMAARAQSELGVIAAHLDSRSQLSARLQSESQLEARQLQVSAANVGSQATSQLEQRSADQLGARIASRAELASKLQNHLASLTRSFESRTEANLEARQSLQLQGRALQSRVAAELAARNQ